MNNSQTNGHKKDYTPEKEYRHLGADVWAEKNEEDEEEYVVYSEEVEDNIIDDDDSDSDSKNN